MTDYSNIKNDIYLFPSSQEGRMIMYSPLRGMSLFVNYEASRQIIDYFDNNNEPISNDVKMLLDDLKSEKLVYPERLESIQTTNKAIFLLSNICNFACGYCYAQHSRNADTLSKEKIANVVDYVYTTPGKNKVFSFLGGGEPTVTWDLLTWSVDYIKSKNTNHSFNVFIGLTTNGSLLNEERVAWLKDNITRVGISFEILPELQDVIRPFYRNKESSFKVVDNAIRLLNRENVPFKIRSTITRASVGRMLEMLDYAQSRYEGIKELHFEPVCDTDDNNQDYYDSFVKNFTDVYVEGRKRGVLIQNSITNALFHIRESYCIGEMCITPEGEIVSCHRHISSNDKQFDMFKYGTVSTSGIDIDIEKLRVVSTYRMTKPKICHDCFAKWNCAGGCISVRATLNENQQSLYCSFIKKQLKALIEQTIILNS